MKKALNEVIAVVVTYNRKELLKECVEALLKQEYKNCSILIVDNASTDGTEKTIKKYVDGKKVIYVNTGENLGGAGGFNFGMKEAYRLGCKYMWLMDDDCIVHGDSLSELMRADKNLKGEYGFLSSKVLWKDGTPCVMNRQKKTFSKWLKDYDANYQTIAMASFVSLFLRSETVKSYGLPIKEFFIWTDDWEYTRRISRKEKCYYISSSIVTHKSKDNAGASIAVVDDRLERFKYLYRNDCVLYRREGLRGWCLMKIRLMIHKLRILKSDKKDKKARMALINRAIKEGKKNYPAIETVEG
jgi:GT2 family glycosyltransferase